MTKSTLPSLSGGEWSSTEWHSSDTCAGVRFQVVRMSVVRRLELTRLVRPLWDKHQYHASGSSVADTLAASELSSELDSTYLRWGLVAIEGLAVDGLPATAELLIERGPEDLCREIIDQIKVSCGLTETERKN